MSVGGHHVPPVFLPVVVVVFPPPSAHLLLPRRWQQIKAPGLAVIACGLEINGVVAENEFITNGSTRK